MRILILSILLIAATSCTRKINSNAHKKNTLCSECTTLLILSDSLWRHKLHIGESDTLFYVLNNFQNITKLRAHWIYMGDGPGYFSYSMKKSLFKIDILRWMRFYNCKDTILLKSLTEGTFTQDEYNLMSNWQLGGLPYVVDTLILEN